MALNTRKDFYGLSTQIKTEGIYAASKLLSTLTGNPVPRNKAIVGKNAFAHESGRHQPVSYTHLTLPTIYPV